MSEPESAAAFVPESRSLRALRRVAPERGRGLQALARGLVDDLRMVARELG